MAYKHRIIHNYFLSSNKRIDLLIIGRISCKKKIYIYITIFILSCVLRPVSLRQSSLKATDFFNDDYIALPK